DTRPKTPPETGKHVEIAGRVLDGGRPVAEAKVSLWAGNGKARPLAETGGDGRFRARVPRADLGKRARLIAQAKGLGADWVELPPPPAGGVTFRLLADVPIQGRVRNLEGRPVAGATVKVTGVEKSATGDLNAYLEAWKAVMRGVALPR